MWASSNECRGNRRWMFAHTNAATFTRVRADTRSQLASRINRLHRMTAYVFASNTSTQRSCYTSSTQRRRRKPRACLFCIFITGHRARRLGAFSLSSYADTSRTFVADRRKNVHTDAQVPHQRLSHISSISYTFIWTAYVLCELCKQHCDLLRNTGDSTGYSIQTV